MSAIPVGQVLFAKYTPLAAAILVLWDHSLTFDEEVADMWRCFEGHVVTKIVYIMNRYFTEVVMLYTAYVMGGATVVLASISQSSIMMSAYRLWDHKPTVRKMLPVVFVISVAGAFILSVLSVLELLRTQIEVPSKAIVCAGHGSTEDDTFHDGYLESEVFNPLRDHSTRVYLFVSLLCVLLLITSLVAEIQVFFPSFGSHVWSESQSYLSDAPSLRTLVPHFISCRDMYRSRKYNNWDRPGR
ncbi:hypothetical protein F5146DRAFT_550124 [Armillaria mellea]|nr:hypothetical protein F5146DRAFT_550124 [Armillaria mellea]